MTSWKRDFASGLIVLGPILVTLFVLYWLYGLVLDFTPEFILPTDIFDGLPIHEPVRNNLADVMRVFVTLSVLTILIFAIGYLMRTTVGSLFERVLDDMANRLPGLRVVYNASKVAAETAFGDQESLQEPVKLEVWEGLRMTAFRTGKTTDDGRDILFLPTSPNITSGFVIEVEQERLQELDEDVEDALTRVLSAGFGDANSNDRSIEAGVTIDVVEEAVPDRRED